MSESQAIDLSHLDGEYQNQEVKEGFDPVPDGRYQVIVERFELKMSKNDKPMLNWQLGIVSGPMQGKKLFVRHMLVTPDNLAWLKTDFHKCGMDHVLPSMLSDETVRAQFCDMYLEVTAKTKGTDDQGRPNQNVYIQKRVYFEGEAPTSGAPNQQAGVAPPSLSPEDEIPF
jgi:Protein of unknown function (DUF669)